MVESLPARCPALEVLRVRGAGPHRAALLAVAPRVVQPGDVTESWEAWAMPEARALTGQVQCEALSILQ